MVIRCIYTLANLLYDNAALSLNLVVGYGGLVSLCHAAFFGLAGYLLAFMTPESGGASLWLSLPVALVVVGSVGLLAWYLVSNTIDNLERQKIASGFHYL